MKKYRKKSQNHLCRKPYIETKLEGRSGPVIVEWAMQPNSQWKARNLNSRYQRAGPKSTTWTCVDVAMLTRVGDLELDSIQPIHNFQGVKWAPYRAHDFPAINAPRLSTITTKQRSQSLSPVSCLLFSPITHTYHILHITYLHISYTYIIMCVCI